MCIHLNHYVNGLFLCARLYDFFNDIQSELFNILIRRIGDGPFHLFSYHGKCNANSRNIRCIFGHFPFDTHALCQSIHNHRTGTAAANQRNKFAVQTVFCHQFLHYRFQLIERKLHHLLCCFHAAASKIIS